MRLSPSRHHARRGTSTHDGVSIAWAVAEDLRDRIGARTLFATHYHELCALAEQKPGAQNLCVAVEEIAGEVVFLHRLVSGSASRSYGIEVARLAGVPGAVIQRAQQLLRALHGQTTSLSAIRQEHSIPADQTQAAVPTEVHQLLVHLTQLDPDQITPLQALNALSAAREQARQCLDRLPTEQETGPRRLVSVANS